MSVVSVDRGIEIIRESVEVEFEPSRERSLAVTKLEECEMWLAKCKPATKSQSPGEG